MKSIVILLATLVGILSSGCKAEYVTGRVCPDGFFYAEEDTPKLLGASYQEIARSPVYSCYQDLDMSPGFNEALSACNDLDADLVTFEDPEEVDRVMNYMSWILDPLIDDNKFLMTSAMYFSDVEKWIWLGSNQTEVGFNITAANVTEQCLAADLWDVAMDVHRFKPVKCNQPIRAMCEVRVQTVTYIAWFYSNWLSFLLVMMTVLLMSAICISVFKYNAAGRRVYRGRNGGNQNRTARVSVSSLPYNDAPPTYNDVTGTTGNAETTTMGKYKNKGKDILAKVTLYRNGGSAGTGHTITTNTTTTTNSTMNTTTN